MEMCRGDLMKRGGANRFPKKQSGSGFASKSKKRMLKKLSLANEMGFELPSSDVSKKKSKSLRDSNGVDHASVPRKLRSAMKKRNLESVSKLSSASKRLNGFKAGTECSKEDNQEMEAKAIGPESMMISKDEKEVAETLYCLAGMFTATDSIDKNTCEAKETSQVESILVVEDDFTKAESLEPVVLVLSSPKTKLISEMHSEQSDKRLSSTRLKQSSSLNVTDSPARVIEEKVETSDMDYKSNGLALWPGLPSTVQSGSNVLLKPSSTKLPSWMGQAVSPSKSEPLRVQPRKLKRCASHIYISRLIKVLQTSKNSPMTLDQIEQISSVRGLSDPVTTISDLKTMVSSSKTYQTPLLLDLHSTQNLKDITQLALELPNPHTLQKQSYDFLSLSSSGATHSHFPFPNSFPQYHISAAQNSHLSPATSNHQTQQLSPNLASRFQTAYNTNQQHHHQQQLQKRLWSAQYRPISGNTVPSSNQYSKPDLSLNLTSIQPIQVTSSPRYNNNVSQQQHRLMAVMSMSNHHNSYPSRTVMNRREHYLPLIYEDSRTPLQLLCDKQS